MPTKRRTLTILLTLLALFLLGTVAVLSTISFYLRIDPPAYIVAEELGISNNNSSSRDAEYIPRIIHQTWKTEILPDRWTSVSQSCRDLMPDYEYKLWTDASSREFIATHYPWFLPTFDAYTYPIQRADVIRYFVLHYFGGVYLDLDVGCLRSLDPLLAFPVVLPKTIPVGISNDLMFAEKGHPFMEQTIHNLVTFDHSYILNYPTVMFSTGPMFLSAQYGLYTASHPPSIEHPGGEVRILPKSLYGKNAKPGEAPNAFFSHHYGSSWHADDAAFITFLGKWGKALMWVGLAVFIFGVFRLIWQKRHKSRGDRARRRSTLGRYDVVLPRAYQREGRFHLDLGFFTVSEPPTETSSPTSATSSEPPSPSGVQPVLPISIGVRPSSPLSPEGVIGDYSASIATRATHAFRMAGIWVRTSIAGASESRPRLRTRRNRGVMYFFPAMFTPPEPRSSLEEHEVPLLATQTSMARQSNSRSRSPMPIKKDLESFLPISDTVSHIREPTAGPSTIFPPPPYESGGVGRPPLSSATEWVAGEGTWGEWTGEESR